MAQSNHAHTPTQDAERAREPRQVSGVLEDLTRAPHVRQALSAAPDEPEREAELQKEQGL